MNFKCLDCLLFLHVFWLEVASNKKLHKQEQITAVHNKGGRIVLFLDLAIRVRTVIIKSSKSDEHTDDHLRNLKSGNNHGVKPFWTELHRHQEVVAVHGCMHTVVHNNKENSWRRSSHIRMPAVQQHSDVMVPM